MTDNDNDNNGFTPFPGVLDSEAAVAGACMISSRHADEAAAILTENDFYDLGHAAVFTAASDLSGRGAHVDEIAVRNHLARTGNLQSLGPSGTRLFELIHQAVTPLDGLRWHADLVRADAIRRIAHMACIQGVQMTAHPTFEPEHIGLILDKLAAADPAAHAVHNLWIRDGLDDFLDSLDKPTDDTVIHTPWPDLDHVVKLRPGQLVVAGARPGGGKSLFGMQVAMKNAITNRIPTLVVSMEMRRAEVMRRIYAAEAGVLLDRLTNHTLDEADWNRIGAATDRIRNAPLVIDDSPHASLQHLRARLRWMSASDPVRLVVVDYLQLMISSRKSENRVLEVTELTRGLKLLAMELDVCVVALAQLNRGAEQRANKKPTLGDLRESGSIENDADTVLFMHPEPDDRRGELDIVVAKQRSGAHGVDVPLVFQGHHARFVPKAWTPHNALRTVA